jgi:hypothetical protein
VPPDRAGTNRVRIRGRSVPNSGADLQVIQVRESSTFLRAEVRRRQWVLRCAGDVAAAIRFDACPMILRHGDRPAIATAAAGRQQRCCDDERSTVLGSEAKPAALGYVFVPWFSTATNSRGIFGDPKARVITLKRRSKKRLVAVAVVSRRGGTIARSAACAIFRAVTHGYFWNWRCGGSRAAVVVR